ncbi:MAG: DEAD/DEAH box helicase family protein, partial [Sciscionella sp.]
FYARRALEQFVDWLYTADRTLGRPYKDNLDARLHEPTFKNLVGHAILTKANLIRKLGNTAVHEKRRIDTQQSLTALRELFHVMYWLGSHYTRTNTGRPTAALVFDPDLLPKRQTGTPAVQSQAQLRQLAERLSARDEELAAAQARSADYDAEIAALRAEIAALTPVRDTHDYGEAQTRGELIDVMLAEAGWTLESPESREYPVTGMPTQDGTRSGRGRVDYVLWGDDGKPLAVIEAKRTSRDARAGQQQATLYADCLEQQFGQRPLIYYTNGDEHWFWDDTNAPPRPVQGFHTKDELALSVQRRTSHRPLADTTINSAIVERHYQQRAIRRITETFERDNQRRALVVMATGAGKTRTVIALVDLLMRCNWVKRVLFLADRLALVNQTVRAFSAHLPDSAPVNLVTEKSTEGRVYVSTYQTMMGMIDAQGDGERRFGIGHFDLVIIDEAHRSVYQKYGALFSYFDALLVGLTATPRDDIDRNTYGLFHIENGVPTDAYTLDEAIDDGYLVPPRPYSFSLGFQRGGIRYDDLSEAEKEQWELLDWNDEGEIPTEVPAASMNKWLFNTDTVDKVLETLMTRGVM